jgi:hypothetical protein
VKRRWLVGFLALSACRTPQIDTVRADFAADKPNAEILDVVPIEGDADHAYYRIRFREISGGEAKEEERGYRRSSDGDWRLFQRDSTRQP